MILDCHSPEEVEEKYTKLHNLVDNIISMVKETYPDDLTPATFETVITNVRSKIEHAPLTL